MTRWQGQKGYAARRLLLHLLSFKFETCEYHGAQIVCGQLRY